ncbi:cystatin-9-like [Hyaena hyaena]|uniref:cystatin-9-like n=1 Tax=Hyaena hyaena TaxID=95912 RepID=UPI0019208BC8|nr:cystatin-9-like [Hyaena hyaena]
MGAQMPEAMPHWECRWALPWAMLLLLLGFQLLGTHSWSSQEERNSNEQKDMENHFPATVEYALYIFNLQSKDLKIEDSLAFSMELEFHRTECGKFDDDIDNCPFQESSELNNTFNCFFTIITMPWKTSFKLLYKTCLEGFH